MAAANAAIAAAKAALAARSEAGLQGRAAAPEETLRACKGHVGGMAQAIGIGMGANAMLALKSCAMNLRLPDFLNWRANQAVAA